ncbi:MAG: MBL fold metallo-hydrolase [Dysosmobacter welbionis]
MLVLDFINVGNGDSIRSGRWRGNGCVFPCWWTAATTAWSGRPPAGGGPRSCRIFAGDFLRSQGVAHLDILLVTHFHRDHIGGLGRVLETVTVGELLTPMRPRRFRPSGPGRRQRPAQGSAERAAVYGPVRRPLRRYGDRIGRIKELPGTGWSVSG